MCRGSALAGLCLTSLLFSATLHADERGWLLGSIAIVANNQFQGNAANATIFVACRGKATAIQADEVGDYAVQLDQCDYQLVKVIAADGKQCRIHSRQHRMFIISNGRTTHFDLMISR